MIMEGSDLAHTNSTSDSAVVKMRRRGRFVGKTWYSLAVFIALEIFAVYSLIASTFSGTGQDVMLCAISMVLYALPYIAEWLFRIHFSGVMEIMCMLFCIGPLFGSVHRLYFIIPCFDDILHTYSGFIGAAIGFALPDLSDKQNQKHSFLLKCVSAFAISMSFAAVWEIFEYSADMLLGTDMQWDTMITNFSSYLLGGDMSIPPVISDIESVMINGEELWTGGYIDVGIIDTMTDMIVCSAGTVAFVLLAAFSRGKLVCPFVAKYQSE